MLAYRWDKATQELDVRYKNTSGNQKNTFSCMAYKGHFYFYFFFQNLNTVNCIHLVSSWEINWTLMILPLIKQVCVRMHVSVGDFMCMVHGDVCPCWYANHPIPLCPLLKITPTPEQQLKQNFRQTDSLHKTESKRERERGITGEMGEPFKSPYTGGF